MKLRRPAIAAVITSAALVLSGCLGIESTSSSQPTVLGPVRLTTVACADGSPDCTATANNPSYYDVSVPAGPVDTQVLYAVRLPAGATAPDSFAAVTEDSTTVTMSRNASYEQQLADLVPAGAGQRWWGYLSTPVTYSRESEQRVTFSLDVTIGRSSDGGPLESPLTYRSVVGARRANGTYPASRPVVCVPASNPTATPYASNEEDGYPANGNGSIVCIDSPDQATTTGAPEQAPFVALAISGTPATAAPGSAGVLSFTARRSGSSAQSAALSATGPAGVTLTPSATTLSLSGAATSTVTVAARVPAGTRAGNYPVTLTATAPGGATETATAVLTVSGDAAGPKVSKVKIKKNKRKVRLVLSEPSKIKVVVRSVSGPKVKKQKTTSRSTGRVSLKLPRLEPGRYKLRVVAKGKDGSKSKPVRRRFNVR